MTYTIDNYELLKERPFKLHDKIVFDYNFKIVTYRVREKWLSCDDHPLLESIIFKELGIEEPISFCSNYYGYHARDVASEYWPDSEQYDYAALTRVVIALFNIIAEKFSIPQYKKLELTSVNIAIL